MRWNNGKWNIEQVVCVLTASLCVFGLKETVYLIGVSEYIMEATDNGPDHGDGEDRLGSGADGTGFRLMGNLDERCTEKADGVGWAGGGSKGNRRRR
jgi:hypothetical protein